MGDRFQDRAEVYAQARPDYPPALAAWLRSEAGWDAASVAAVADVGCGTGISTRMLLRERLAVAAVGVDPSAAMLAQAAAAEPSPHSSAAARYVCGAAEDLDVLLGPHSIDAIAVAQAFHWLDREKCRRAFYRALSSSSSVARPVALWWNRRDVKSPFGRQLEAVVDRHCTQYRAVDHRNVTAQGDAVFRAFFGSADFASAELPHSQRVDRVGFLARLRSSSYVPAEGSPEWDAMRADLDVLFDAYKDADESITLHYSLLVVAGKLVP